MIRFVIDNDSRGRCHPFGPGLAQLTRSRLQWQYRRNSIALNEFHLDVSDRRCRRRRVFFFLTPQISYKTSLPINDFCLHSLIGVDYSNK